jgi:hypothetical protein
MQARTSLKHLLPIVLFSLFAGCDSNDLKMLADQGRHDLVAGDDATSVDIHVDLVAGNDANPAGNDANPAGNDANPAGNDANPVDIHVDDSAPDSTPDSACDGAPDSATDGALADYQSRDAVGSAPTLHAIWGNSKTDIWIVGQGGLIFRKSTTGWNRVTSNTTASLKGVWGASATMIWAVGDGVIMHQDGQGWKETFVPLNHNRRVRGLAAIHGVSASDIWAVGDQAVVYHFDGTSWRYGPPYESLGLDGMSVWGTGGKFWAVFGGVGDGIHFYESGKGWQKVLSQPSYLSAIRGRAANDVWAVGRNGMVAHYDGSSWTSKAVSTASLDAVWPVAANDVWVVGHEATTSFFLHYDGNAWSRVASPTSAYLRAIWGAAADDIWAVGDDSAIVHYDGASWTVSSQGRQ